MAKKILGIIQTAYRATLEEQDDTVIWLTHSMRAAGADLTVLLRGNAVNYAVRGQDASGLAFGDRRQTNPPRLDDDLAKLPGKGVEVFLIEDDVAERGIDRSELIEGVKPIPRKTLVKLLGSYDQVWHW
jgi:sulfur transfer complex TusBCD TusB component (DsrH family)